jgi:hypothetical protein
MYILIGTTPKGEVFVIGHTTSRKRAERFVNEYDVETGEFSQVEMQYSRNI